MSNEASMETLIDDFSRGIEEGRYASVVATTRRFVLFRVGGHSSWDGRSSRTYAPVQHVLIRKRQWWMGKDADKREWRGRVARHILIDALKKAERTGTAREANESEHE